MQRRNEYLLLNYRDLPDVDFICKYGTETRIKVSIKERSKITCITSGMIYGKFEQLFFVFENISCGYKEIEETLAAVQWYREVKGFQKMMILKL